MSKQERIANRKKERMLKAMQQSESLEIQPVSLLDDNDELTGRCKFNFHYLISAAPAASCNECGNMLLPKLKDFSQYPLEYWKNQRYQGSDNGYYFTIYGDFPPEDKTAYIRPPSIPAEAQWARFVLTGKQRLIGFVIPEELHDREHSQTHMRFDKNTFYVVFIDLEHKFWLTNP